MSGCDWQNKSFSVAVEGKVVLGNCGICGSELHDTIYKHNGDSLCRDCFRNKPTLRQRLGINDFGVFSTTRDKLYNFNHQFTLNEKPIEITSKGHWKKELKKRGLTDDFEQKQKRPEDLRSPMQDYKTVDRKFIRDEMLRELQEKGLRHKLIRRR